jgi:hypothetical protein
MVVSRISLRSPGGGQRGLPSLAVVTQACPPQAGTTLMLRRSRRRRPPRTTPPTREAAGFIPQPIDQTHRRAGILPAAPERGSPEGDLPSGGGLGVSPKIQTFLGRVGGSNHAHVSATTPTPPTCTRRRIDTRPVTEQDVGPVRCGFAGLSRQLFPSLSNLRVPARPFSP